MKTDYPTPQLFGGGGVEFLCLFLKHPVLKRLNTRLQIGLMMALYVTPLVTVPIGIFFVVVYSDFHCRCLSTFQENEGQLLE